MKQIEPSVVPAPGPDRVGRKKAAAPKQAPENPETEEQAFYAAQEEAFTDLRAYHAGRPRRKR